ncbi:MAG: PHP domain-containing protein [Candidatus Firestonebacteria bacterium]
MKNGYADLHTHTNVSDSTFTVDELLNRAKSAGLMAVSITDHDGVEAIDEAMKINERLGIEIIPGIELSAEENDIEVHMLGYFINWNDKDFLNKLKILREARLERARKIIEKLNNLNIKLCLEDVLKLTKSDTSIGRLHIARALKNAGYISDVREAFKNYIGQDGPAYVRKYFISPVEAINMIKKIGGIPVLAHPAVLNNDALIFKLIPFGLAGLEVYRSEHSTSQVEHYKELAVKNNLLITGGSDCHGLGKSKILIGTILIPYHYVECLKKYKSILTTP